MAWTTEAWLREALSALRRTLDVDARTKNEMVQFLLDEGFWDKEKISSWESAIAKFNSCLNPNKSEFFKIGELWALAKRFGRHDLFLAMAADLGYEVPRGDRHNTRHGRTEPTWAAAGEAKYMDVPGAPLNRQPGRAALDSTDPMAGLSREQLLAMLLVGDELSAATARFQAEVEGIKDRARRVLAGGSIS